MEILDREGISPLLKNPKEVDLVDELASIE